MEQWGRGTVGPSTKQLHSSFCKSKNAFCFKALFQLFSNVNFTTGSHEIHGIGFAISVLQMERLSSFYMTARKEPVQIQDPVPDHQEISVGPSWLPTLWSSHYWVLCSGEKLITS